MTVCYERVCGECVACEMIGEDRDAGWLWGHYWSTRQPGEKWDNKFEARSPTTKTSRPCQIKKLSPLIDKIYFGSANFSNHQGVQLVSPVLNFS